MTGPSEARHTVFPDRSTVYLTTQGWRASTPWGRTSPPQPTRADALNWLARRLRERQKSQKPEEATHESIR